jgi:hypothetical protein
MREVLYNIFIEFGVWMKLITLIKMGLYEACVEKKYNIIFEFGVWLKLIRLIKNGFIWSLC